MTDLRKTLLSKRERWSLKGALSTGSTLLNLACTENPDAGFLRGGYYYFVGDSASGKTWFSLSCLAEACKNDAYKKHRLIYDDVEGGALMDKEKYFGRLLTGRLEPPAGSKDKPRYSSTVESFYYHVWDAVEAKVPFIYVLDSQDALTSDPAVSKFLKQRKASVAGQEAAGSFGDGKAKYHSEHLRQVLSCLRKRGSILIVIGQTRDNLGFGFERKVRSGGRALGFYANLEIWTSLAGKLKRPVRGVDRTVGVRVLAEVRKNRVTGKIGRDRAVTVPIYYGLGIDDIGSCVNFLIDEGHWPRISKGVWDAREVLVQGSREKIIAEVEEESLEAKVREIAAKVWREIEEECLPKRKPRYL